MESTRKVDLLRTETVAQLNTLNFTLIDSVIELSPRDTVTRVRYVRASSLSLSSSTMAENQAIADTVLQKGEETAITPIAVEEKKKGVSVALRRARMVNALIFFVFFAIFIVCVKKMLLLRRN